jgi:hypothetical protein
MILGSVQYEKIVFKSERIKTLKLPRMMGIADLLLWHSY